MCFKCQIFTNSIFGLFLQADDPQKEVAAVNCVPNHSYLYDTSFLFTGCRVEYSLSSLQGRFLSFKGIVMASFSKHQLVDISVRFAVAQKETQTH